MCMFTICDLYNINKCNKVSMRGVLWNPGFRDGDKSWRENQEHSSWTSGSDSPPQVTTFIVRLGGQLPELAVDKQTPRLGLGHRTSRGPWETPPWES
ncbi:hypothetical protein ElyMa_001092600 [Elysia marginata]|uniref:Uncharacterized protein n=1 Tax=Elysia marginata TaxID=1093978 RepID=A0AAV4HV43_9GAST|nr:hypothetical protein ElyMa_001092600 [Elysia marginata]